MPEPESIRTTLIFIGAVLTTGYLFFVISVLIGIFRLKKGSFTGKPFVSVITAARNEEQNIGPLLEKLIQQDYPGDNFEIIIVNDRSEDTTGKIIDLYAEKDHRIKRIDITEIPPDFSPKKFALTQGIGEAKGDIICTTDADCLPPATWVSAMVSHFHEDVGMILGYSPVIVEGGGKLFSEYRAIDALSLAVVAAGGAGLNIGWVCTGRNLAYRKQLFSQVGGYEDVRDQISGDDDLLLHMVQKKTAWKIRFAIGSEASIPSTIKPGTDNFVNQRTRHASKFRVHPPRIKAVSILIFSFYLAFWSYPVIMLAMREIFAFYGVMAGSKFIVEYAAVSLGARKLDDRFTFATFLRAFFIHPLLIMYFGIRGVRGKFTWKDRKYHQK